MPKYLNPRPATPSKADVGICLRRKLNPARFTRMSGKMAAMVGYIVGAEHWGNPPIREMIVTSDRFVLGRIGEQIGFDTFFGSYADLVRNWLSLLSAADLSSAEFWEAECLFAERVGFYGRSIA